MVEMPHLSLRLVDLDPNITVEEGISDLTEELGAKLIDTNGNLYITSRIGVQVWSPAGEYLGNIEFPQQPANVTFGGKDRKTLYATCRTGFYSVPMQAQGHVFTGKE